MGQSARNIHCIAALPPAVARPARLRLPPPVVDAQRTCPHVREEENTSCYGAWLLYQTAFMLRSPKAYRRRLLWKMAGMPARQPHGPHTRCAAMSSQRMRESPSTEERHRIRSVSRSLPHNTHCSLPPTLLPPPPAPPTHRNTHHTISCPPAAGRICHVYVWCCPYWEGIIMVV